MIKAEEISEIIKRQLQGFEAEIDLKESGRVIEVGDGIARIYGLEKALAGELLSSPAACSARAQPRGRTTWARCSSATTPDQGRRSGHPHQAHRAGAGRRGAGRPRRQRARPSGRWQGPDRDHGVPADRAVRSRASWTGAR
jgi:hypothetical protein